MDERRRYPRIPAAWPLRLHSDEDDIGGYLIDVSAYGLCVATAPTASLKLGKAYRIEVLAGIDRSFECDGEVRYVGSQSAGIETRQFIPLDRF